MYIYKNLCIYLASLCVLSFLGILLFSSSQYSGVPIAFISAPVSVFAVSTVFLVAAFVMYKSSQSNTIKTLKRRGGRVYGELLHHKMRLIDVMDGKRTFVDIEKYLYPEDAFLRIKKFLFEDYFLLLAYDPFFKKTNAFEAVKAFYSLHKDLETFMRSQNYDIIEYNKFKILYQKVYRQPIVADTLEETFNHPDLVEALEIYHSGLDYALVNADALMTFLEAHLTELDKYFTAGVPWPITKDHLDNEFRLWIHANS